MSDEANLPTSGTQQALLRWAVENATDPEAKQGGMDPVRKEQAMKNIKDLGPEWYEALFGKSDVEVMKEQIKLLNKFFSREAAEEIKAELAVQSLEQIGYLVELTHNANDFPKLGGFDVLLSALKDSHEEVRMHSCWIIAKSASNNPEFQGKIMTQTDALPLLIDMLQSDASVAVRAKALHAVSSIVRNAEDGMKAFIKYKGFHKLVSMLSIADRNVQARTVFFMTYCLGADHSASLSSLLLEEGYVQQVLHLLKERDFDLREKALVMLTELGQSGGPMFVAVMQSINAPAALQELLNDEEDWLKEDPEQDHFDVLEFARNLLHKLK